MAGGYNVPHVVDFDPQLREAFLTVESHLDSIAADTARQAGIVWWNGNGDPNMVMLPNARGGDLYIDQLTGDVYRDLDGNYTRSLTGAENESRAVDPGTMWWDGTADPTSTAAPYRVRDYWLNTTSCDIWVLT